MPIDDKSPSPAPTLYCIELRTSRWAETLAWYRNVLGSRCLVRVVDDGYALLDVGNTRLALLARTEVGGPSGRWSLAFEVDDLAPILKQLRDHSPLVATPETDKEGLSHVRCWDPDGNLIRLFRWPTEP